MRKFTVTRVYGKDDPEFVCDALEVMLTDEGGKVILSGDWYHDKIDTKIDGFFEALDYLGVSYGKTVEYTNDPETEVCE